MALVFGDCDDGGGIILKGQRHDPAGKNVYVFAYRAEPS
jgi:hypothetical protein